MMLHVPLVGSLLLVIFLLILNFWYHFDLVELH